MGHSSPFCLGTGKFIFAMLTFRRFSVLPISVSAFSGSLLAVISILVVAKLSGVSNDAESDTVSLPFF